MPQDFFQILWIFFIYACIGWALEVAYATLNTGKFINRGFLNGPLCPIYGCGMLLAIICLYPLKENLIILFAGALFFATLLELLTGYALEKLFHNKWWDYSKLPFNFKGYICLKFSIYWGAAGVFVIKIIHPVIYSIMQIVPPIISHIFLYILIVAIISDITVTVISVLKLNKHIYALEEIAIKLHTLSEELGENISDTTLNAQERNKQLSKKYHEDREKIEAKYKELMSHTPFGAKRIINAFPNMRHVKRDEIFKKYKQHLEKNIHK